MPAREHATDSIFGDFNAAIYLGVRCIEKDLALILFGHK
jgi:hypothetical protein